jgi:phosphoribosylformylglycinamidine cyclo-ligase
LININKLFCKIVPDYLTQDEDYCLIMHAEPGTNPLWHTCIGKKLAVFPFERHCARLSIMNIDLLCVAQQIIFYFRPPSEEIKI